MIRCLIVDDEPIAIRVLQAHLDKIPDVEVVATCSNAVEALRWVREGAIDLAFLDIEMPSLSGIGFVESLGRPPRFVFTTAHRDYAFRGFDLDAVDYLLKPIGFPRLLRAVEKYRRVSAGEKGSTDTDVPTGAINVRVDRRTVRLDPRQIAYVESLSDYVVIHTDSGRYTSKMRISELEDQLLPYGFMRIHRSYLVSVSRVDSFTSTELQLAETALPVSRSYRRQVMERLADSLA